MSIKIPKIFWQSYKTHNIPSKWINSPTSIKDFHPDWQYILTDDEENLKFVSEFYPQYLELYNRVGREIKFICSVDMVRYLYLHKYGGVYLDLDYQIIKPIDDLFYNDTEIYLFRTSNSSGFTNSFMASKPNCPFWINCIDKIKHRIDHCPFYIFGDIRVLWTTGPGMLTDVAGEYDKPFVTIPYKLGHPCNICDIYLDRKPDTPGSYVKVLEGSSWTSPTTRLLYFFVCRRRTIIPVVIIILIIIILIIISHYLS